MQRGFTAKLMTIMGIFSILLTLSVSFVNQNRLKDSLAAGNNREFSLVADHVITAISDADKAFQLLDGDLEKTMNTYSGQLLDKYKENPEVGTWDYQALKKEFDGMDIYIINDRQTIIYSSFTKDIGLDFREKDGSLGPFARLLADRLEGSAFIADSLDQETNTGKIKKYSYVPTHDHKYLIELGVDQENSAIFKSFNFPEISRQLVNKYNNLDDITVFTTSGKSIGKKGADGKTLLVAEVNRPFLASAYTENTMQEVKGELDGSPVTYRYVPYSIQSHNGVIRHTDQRVIEIIYNENELQNKLTLNKQVFVLQLLGTIAIALMICYLITLLVAKPMYLAFHDLLTGLWNRAAIESSLASILARGKKKGIKTGLMIIDLDNFKTVNDTLGHDAGDHLLKEVSRRIGTGVRNAHDIAARLGGDEFIVLLGNVQGNQASAEVAQRIIEELKRPMEIKGIDVVKAYNVTVSIGIALAPEHAQDAEELYNAADIALYNAKRTGKNTYRVYNESMRND